LGGLVRVHAGGGEQLAGVRARQRGGLRRVLAAGAGDDHLHDTRLAGTRQHRVAVVVEAVVWEVGADVHKVHRPIIGRPYPVRVSAPAFPIDDLLPDIRASLAAHPRLVLEAPPGAGKTTRVPPALLDEGWLRGRRIVMLEPRRVAARAAAGFMAAQRGEEVGATV